MKAALIAVMILAAGAAHAEWATNAWPSYDFQRAGKVQALNCYSALVERCQATETWSGQQVANPSAPAWYRSQRSNLTGMKTKALALIASEWYLDSTQADTNGAFLPAFTEIPEITLVAVCVEASLPTNYFAYTPWRCLNGLGPFTNDTTVGRGYGWTNATTAAGGTNFPAGRSTWYTTDYGWQGLHDALNILTITKAGNDNATSNKTFTTGEYASFGEMTNAVYSELAIADWESDIGTPICDVMIYHDPSTWYAGGVWQRTYFTAAYMSTNTAKSVVMHYTWNGEGVSGTPNILGGEGIFVTSTSSGALAENVSRHEFGDGYYSDEDESFPIDLSAAAGLGENAQQQVQWSADYEYVVNWDFLYK